VYTVDTKRGKATMPTTEIVEAGIDYLTMTLTDGTEDYETWAAGARDAVGLLAAHGNVPKPGGFRGFQGVWCGGAFVGDREHDTLLVVPGSWASRLWQNTYHGRAHYSRLDLQVTVRYADFDKELSKKSYQWAAAMNEDRPLQQRRKLKIIEDSDGGSTLYIGSRSSEHFCRLYNKMAASDDPLYENCWRYEVELHNDSATAASRYIYEGARSQPRAVSSTVWQYFTQRGILTPWPRESEENAVLPRSSPRTDIERKLNWLTTQVQPTVRLLLQHVDASMVLRALGYGPEAQREPVENRPANEEADNGR
jgi:hypothetical protein